MAVLGLQPPLATGIDPTCYRNPCDNDEEHGQDDGQRGGVFFVQPMGKADGYRKKKKISFWLWNKQEIDRGSSMIP